MDYCTIDDIENHVSTSTLIQLTSDDGQEKVDCAVAEEAILYSSTLINGYLRGRYSLPLSTPFPLLRIIAIDISVYRLYSRRMRGDIPEIIYEQYKYAVKMLQEIQKGAITLEIFDEILSDLSSGNYRSNKVAANRTFDKAKMDEY